jgi:hypothetical protein
VDRQLIEEEVRVQREAPLRGRPSKYPLEFQRDAVATMLDEHRNIASG